MVIHWSDWAGQPDVRIACDQTWGSPACGYDLKPFKLEDGRLYSFSRDEVTCPECRAEIEEVRDE